MPRILSSHNKNKSKFGSPTFPDFKTYKATVITILWCWHNDKCTNRWNLIQNFKINPYIYDQLIFNRGAKAIQWEKNYLFN